MLNNTDIEIEKQWQVLDSDTTNNFNICIIQYSSNAGASVDKCLTIDENLMLTCYMHSAKLSSLGKFQFSLKVNDSLRTNEEVCDVLTNIHIPPCTNCSDSQFLLILQLALSLLIPLKSENFKFHKVIWFMYEQLRLMTQSVYCYFYDFLVFASVFLQFCTKRLQVYANKWQLYSAMFKRYLQNSIVKNNELFD